MKTVAQLVRAKSSSSVIVATPDMSVLDAIKLMAQHRIGALVVMEGERLVGMFSERDYARKVILLGRSSGDTRVSEIMSTAVVYVKPDQTNEECMAIMTERHIRHLPVMEDDRLVGLLSIGDLVKDIISEQQFVIDQLQHYITGARF